MGMTMGEALDAQPNIAAEAPKSAGPGASAYASAYANALENTAANGHGNERANADASFGALRTLVLPPRERGRILAGARRAGEREACGLLLGLRQAATTSVARAACLENVNPPSSGVGFRLHPVAHLRWERWAHAAGLAVVGVWHSHPGGPGWPSRADRAGAAEGWSHLIAAPGAGGELHLRSWSVVGGALAEQILLAGPDPASPILTPTR
jgi:proteasome lid subunit RPN8/RPN11